MTRLLDLVAIYFDWDPVNQPGEFSIELDPRETSDEMLQLLRRRDFNRLSFGVQDFDPRTQVAINRVQSFELVQHKVAAARDLGFNSISFDLICGLPHQTSASFARTWEQTLSLSPERISLYNYAHLPDRFKPQRRIDPASMPSADTKLHILRDSIELLQQAGYLYVGMDHFAKPSDALATALQEGSLQRNFQGYSTKAETDMLALGVSCRPWRPGQKWPTCRCTDAITRLGTTRCTRTVHLQSRDQGYCHTPKAPNISTAI